MTAVAPVTPLGAFDPARHPPTVYLARLAEGSRPCMASALDTIARLATHDRATARTFAWHRLDYATAQAIRTAIAAKYSSPATANRHLTALRGVLKVAWRLELMSAEVYQRASDLEPIRGHTEPRGRALKRAELDALFTPLATDVSLRGIRDRALLSVLVYGGLRRAEVAALELVDIRDDGRELLVRGKGKKQRVVPLPPRAALPLGYWLAILRGLELTTGRVFRCLTLPFGPDGVRTPTLGRVIDKRSVQRILWRRCDESQVRRASPHDLRRTYASTLLKRGADLSTVADLMGHANVNTTRRYDKRGLEAKRKAAALLED